MAEYNKENGETPKTALTFEISEEDEGGLVFDSEADIIPEPAPKKKEEPVKELTDEFSIPDSFEIDEGMYGSSSFIDDPTQLRPTYVPRFTEVSETYRMKGDPRPKPAESAAPTPTAKKEEPKPSTVDATSEIEEEKTVTKVVVTSTAPSIEEPQDESITLFKFVSEDAEPVHTAEKKTEEVEALVEEANEAQCEEEPVTEEAPTTHEEPEKAEKPKDIDPFSPEYVEVRREKVDIDNTEEELSTDDMPEGSLDGDAPAARGFEFTKPIEKDGVKDRFLDSIMSKKVRLFASLALVAIMIAVDLLTYFGVNIYNHIGLYGIPSAKAVIDLQFSACLFLLAIPELVFAFKTLFKKQAMPELVLLPSLIFIAVYTVVIINTGAMNYSTYGILLGIQVVASIYASFQRTAADYAAFRIISKNTVKNILEKRLTRSLPRENIALDGVIDEYKSKTGRMFRTAFVSDFFARTSKTVENTFNVLMMLAVSFGVAVTTGVVSFFLSGYSAVDGFGAFTLVFMLAFPAFSILVHKLPYNRAIREAEAEDSTFVGEASVLESRDIDVIAYQDTEIFGIEDVSIRKVHLYGKVENTPKAMREMYSLFSVVGGPLDRVFTASLDKKCAPATDIEIEDDGISGVMEGRRVYAGNEEYMHRHGIRIPGDDYKTKTSGTDSTKVMYGASDGEVYVKFFIRYSFSEEFTMLLPYLKEEKIVPLIYTRDPNINNELLKVLTLGEDIIRVMKKQDTRKAEEKVYRRASAGVVTLGEKSNAINTVLLAKKYGSFQSMLASSELIAMLSGAVIAVLFAITGSLSIPVTALASLELLWCLYLFIRTNITFRKSKTEKGNK